MNDGELWTSETNALPGGSETDRLAFLNNAPMPAALVNDLITEFHGAIADRLAEKMYANASDLPSEGPRPTFAAYAHYASASVGEQLRAPIPSGRRRRARALVDGNRDVAFTVGSASLAFLNDEPRGDEPPPGPTHDLWFGFDRYRQAEQTADIAEKSRLILEGNERILAFEQRLLEPHLGVAFRITSRRVTSPMSRFSTSQREWRARDPGKTRLVLENLVARMATLGIGYKLPGQPSVLRPIRRLAVTEPEPHDCRVDQQERSRLWCWMCFDHRTAWIVQVFHQSHNDRWFDERATTSGTAGDAPRFRLRRAPAWRGSGRARSRYRRRYLSGPTNASAPRRPAIIPSEGDLTHPLNQAAKDTPARPATVSPTGTASQADWQAATTFYNANRAEVFAALVARSLPATFASLAGAPVLDPESVAGTHRDGLPKNRLAGDSFPRVARTVRFLDEVFEGGVKRTSALEHARGRHSEVRDELDDWKLGTPVNQEHMLATVTTFVCPVRQVFDEFGFGDADAPWDSWARVWAEIGIWLGLDEQYLFSQVPSSSKHLDYADLLDIAMRLDVEKRERNLAGVRLMDNLIADLSDGYPRAARRLPVIALWSLGDEELLRMLLVPPSVRGSLGRSVAVWAADANPVVRRIWAATRRVAARWILAEIASADDLGPFDPLRYFPPDCSVTDLDTYQPVPIGAVVAANVNQAI